MGLRVVGAGLGRTATASLKAALEQLLDGRCYHMTELFEHPEHVDTWTAAARGEDVDWAALLAGYDATVDWPGAAFWAPLAAANPDAVILLSTRASAEAWWQSASETIFFHLAEPTPPGMEAWRAMWDTLAGATFTPDYLDRDAAIVAYQRHNEQVRATADPARLVEWQAGDGWGPLCEALGLPIPEAPFPHLNTTEEWVARRSGGRAT
ncbi:MAG TPA: sulfotransferase [Acidimicrobiales bacterium]|nr:sulfotransferase [Acidimicrobiales bacterium]